MNLAEVRELAESRLPKHYDDLNLTFYGSKSWLDGDQVVIGNDYANDLCVRLSDGSIYTVDREGEYPTLFVNSGIEQLARFIEVSDSFGGSKLDRQKLAQRIRDALSAIDERATENPNWWGLVLEQLESGL